MVDNRHCAALPGVRLAGLHSLYHAGGLLYSLVYGNGFFQSVAIMVGQWRPIWMSSSRTAAAPATSVPSLPLPHATSDPMPLTQIHNCSAQGFHSHLQDRRVCRGGRGRTVHSDPMPLTQIHNCSGLHGDGCTLSRLLHPLYFHVRPRVHIQSPGVPIQIFIACACGEKLNPVESTLRAKELRQPGASLRGEASSIKAPQLSSRRMRVCSGPEANRPPLSKKPLRVRAF